MKTEMGKGSLHGERKQATREELKEVHGKDWKRGRENNESEKRQEAFAELAKYADSADEIDNEKFEPDLLGSSRTPSHEALAQPASSEAQRLARRFTLGAILGADA